MKQSDATWQNKKQRGRGGPGGEKRTDQKDSKVSRCDCRSSRLQDYVHGDHVISVVTADPDYSQINVAKRRHRDLLSLFVRLHGQATPGSGTFPGPSCHSNSLGTWNVEGHGAPWGRGAVRSCGGPWRGRGTWASFSCLCSAWGPRQHPCSLSTSRCSQDSLSWCCGGSPMQLAWAFGMQGRGQVVIFLEDSLGLYPYYTPQKQAVSGGLPQHTRLNTHLQEVEADLAVCLPSVDFGGLVVLRWDQWAPQWGQNMVKQEIYQEESRLLLRGFFPDWSPTEVDRWAQVDFETAAQVILIETLRKLKRLRPKASSVPYPNCYNSGPTKHWANYTGRCPATEMARNDELLWRYSSALYPLLQLDNLLGGTPEARLYASAQVREALRVAALAGAPYDLPVFPLIRSVYTSTNMFLSEGDLVNTIGDSAAMRAVGVIVWEKVVSDKSQRGCWKLADFVREVLGPYMVNVTTASRLCGRGRGHCVRRDPGGSAYLHLPPATFPLLPDDAGLVEAEGQRDAWRSDFQCQRYRGLEGGAADECLTQGGAEGRDWEGTTSTIRETELSESPRATMMTLKAERTPTATTLTTEPASAPPNQSVSFLISSPLGLLLSAICLLDFWLMC